MKLATFTHDGRTRIGVVSGEEIVDLSECRMDLPRDMIGFLAAGPEVLEEARKAEKDGPTRFPLADVHLEAPVPRPSKFLAAGLNYADHVKESGAEQPKFPVIFTKQITCVTGPHDPIHMPKVSQFLDYEGELGLVIGRRCRNVPKEKAAEVIAGYVIVDDVSVRDWQIRSPTMMLGKSFDTHGPFGPWIVTGDEIGDPHNLGIRTWVNGEERQNSNTEQLIFDCYSLVETLSTAFTLEPGDVVATGTPEGVGAAMNPRSFLKVGDVVKIEIERIGSIENEVIPEPEAATL